MNKHDLNRSNLKPKEQHVPFGLIIIYASIALIDIWLVLCLADFLKDKV